MYILIYLDEFFVFAIWFIGYNWFRLHCVVFIFTGCRLHKSNHEHCCVCSFFFQQATLCHSLLCQVCWLLFLSICLSTLDIIYGFVSFEMLALSVMDWMGGLYASLIKVYTNFMLSTCWNSKWGNPYTFNIFKLFFMI